MESIKKQIKTAWEDMVSKKTRLRLIKARVTLFFYARKYFEQLQKTDAYKYIDKQQQKVPKKYKIIGLIVVGSIVVFLGYQLITSFGNNTSIGKQTNPNQLVKGTPDYNTIIPSGKTIKQLGGWTRISPPKASPVYTYIDRIENVQINVSEQPLPPNFKSDSAGQLKQLAENSNATQKITIGGNVVYIGTSSQGPQSVFFVKNNLLVLIKSDAGIGENSWIQYINSLR